MKGDNQMAGINFIGSYSGIDQSIIDKLMEVERLPLNQFNTKKESITEKQNAWKDVKFEFCKSAICYK